MNELLAKIKSLSQQVEGITAQQTAALVKAEAEGAADDDRAKATAEFDRLEAEKAPLLARAKELQARVNLITAANSFTNAPATPPLNTGVASTGHQSPAAGRQTVPAAPRRHGPLRAFRSQGAEAAERAGLWVAAAMLGQPAAREAWEDRNGPLAATMSTTNNGTGGYFVPDVMDTAIVELTEEYGVARRLCDVQGMSSDSWTGPRWTGTLTTQFVAEGSAPTAPTEPTFDLISLVAKNLACYGKLTANLADDSLVDLAEKWAMYAAIAFAQKEDDCVFNGTATSTYGGITGVLAKLILAANAASLVTATGNTTLGALTLANFWGVVGKLPRYPGIQPRWFCHQEVYAASMGPLQTAAGGVTPQDIASGGIPRFLGYPVEFVNVMPAAASVTTGVTGIVFGDLRMGVKFGDRRGRTMRTTEINDDAIKQLLTLVAHERFDANFHTPTDPKDTSKPGPVIGLKLG